MSSLFDLVADIRGFTGALGQEIKAFEETRTAHDQKRARRALDHLADMVADLDEKVKGVQLSTENDE